MTFASRLGHFVLFSILSIITFGLYPLYFVVTRMETANHLLEQILIETRRQGGYR